MKPVTDPALLEELNKPVTDPKVLAQLNAPKSAAPQDEYTIGGWNGIRDNPIMVNLGAGADNVIQGVKQLFGKGDDDETIEERRRIKAKAAEEMPGGGLVQLGGEILASYPLTAGTGALAGKAGLKFFPKAAEWALTKGTRAANVGTAARAGLEGAASGLLTETTSDESKGLNTGLGATAGVVTTGLIAGGSRLKKALSKKAAPERAAKVFEQQLGKEELQHIDDALHDPMNVTSLPLSTASKSQSVPLAALERGARGRSDWGFNHDKKVAEKAWDDILKATKNADELGSRVDAREEVMRASKDYLNGLSDPATIKQANAHLGAEVQSLRSTPISRQNPEVTNILGQVEQMLAHPDASAGDFASQYWRLSDMIDGGKLTTEQADIVRKLRTAVAEAGDIASDGEMSALLGRYKAEQAHVGQSEASKAIRETFQTPEGVAKTTRQWNGTPEPQSSVLRKTMAAKGENQYGNVLDDETRQGLGKIQSELERHELWQARNAPGPSSLDIENPLSVISSGRDNPFNFLPLVKGGANWLFSGSRKATTEAADAAMQDPQAWARMMEQYRLSKTPISPEEYAARIRRQLVLTPGRAAAAGLGGD